MADTEVDELFSTFEAEMAGTFRPAELADLAARAHRRRQARHAGLAGLVALVLLGTAGVLTVQGSGGRAPSAGTTPEPSLSAAISPDGPTRRVVLPGVDLPLTWVWLVGDAQHAWAQLGACETSAPAVCHVAFGVTADAGRTWRRVTLPEIDTFAGRIEILPLDADTASVLLYPIAGTGGIWLTVDGGNTFARYPFDAPPTQTQRAGLRGRPGNQFFMGCANNFDWLTRTHTGDCDDGQLIKIGSGPVQPQPPFPIANIVEGADGRLWAMSGTPGLDRQESVAYSNDAALTWHQIRVDTVTGSLVVSPDGSDVWLVDGYDFRLFRLSGGRFVPVGGLPATVPAVWFVALGGGVAVVSGSDTSGFLHDGVFTPIAGRYSAVSRTDDGTILLSERGSGRFLVGSGTGINRSWYWLT